LLRAFVSVIAQHPEIQTKAQKELDRVVGRDRLPNLDDEGNLHYVRSIIKVMYFVSSTRLITYNYDHQEVERLYNPLPLGTPHFNTEDFAYRGLLIPKETVIVINNVSWFIFLQLLTHLSPQYTIHRDPTKYPEPNLFKVSNAYLFQSEEPIQPLI
jgi:cytochrome P450